MKKRLRKKLYRGEFQELAFPLRFSLDPALDQSALDGFFDRFDLTGLEANTLSFSGTGGRTWTVL